MSDYYRVLNLNKNASADEIKKAYRVEALLWHPDRNPEDGAELKFKELQEAYSVISDPELRSLYDKHGAAMVKEFQQQRLHQQQHFRSQPKKAPVQTEKFIIDVKQVFHGAAIEFHTFVNRTCALCKGSGLKPGKSFESLECTTCKGEGVQRIRGSGMMQQFVVPCMSCQGRGIKMLAEWQCTGCFGKKVVSTPYSTTMHLEPGFIFQTPEKSLGYEGHYVQPLNSNMELMVQFVMPGKPEIGFGLPALTQKERIDEGNWENGGVYLPKFRFADSLSLSFRKVISLSDYMGGVDFVFRHLDGEQVRIQYVASSFDLERDRFLLVPDLGFPLPTLGKQGCLVIELLVKMPTVENVSFNATEMKISLESMIIPYVLKYATKSVQVVVAAESKLMQEEAHASRSSNEEAEGVNGCRQM